GHGLGISSVMRILALEARHSSGVFCAPTRACMGSGGPQMQIAVLTFDGFNELDSFIAANILNRMKAKGWAAHITSPTPEVTSMNGVTVRRQRPLEFAAEADAVLIGSGIKTRDIAADADLLSRIVLDPSRQLVGAQCSGTLLLAKLGLVGKLPACTDL